MLSQDVERYVTLQRTLGYKFGDQSRSLKLFADYADAHGDEFVRVERVLAWAAAQTPSAQRRQSLVARVRRFALAMHAESPRHEVPPRDCVGHAKNARKPPYIYNADEVDRIMRTAGQMPAKGFIAPATLTTLLGLLASTGLRISEALSLECSDVGDEGLIIRKSKHGKSRLIPLHETTQAALERHLGERARQAVYTQAVFVSSNGQALMYHVIRDTFRRLMVRAGLRPQFSGTGPRMHDLRHYAEFRTMPSKLFRPCLFACF
jgi:integrase